MSFYRSVICAAALFAVQAVPSGAGESADIAVKSCLNELGLPAAACSCIGRRVESEFNAKQQKFFIAMITKNKPAMAAQKGDMTVNELTQVAMFMTTAPNDCVNQ